MSFPNTLNSTFPTFVLRTKNLHESFLWCDMFCFLLNQNTCPVQDLWDLSGEHVDFESILSKQTNRRDQFNVLLHMVIGKVEYISGTLQNLTEQLNINKLPWQENVLQAIATEINNVAMAVAPQRMANFSYKSDGKITSLTNPVAKQCFYCRLILSDIKTMLNILKNSFGSFKETKFVSFLSLLQRVYCVLAFHF